ncbi:hypothetical protein K438DRAFT_1996607 [Mycena galopus ATCC 62051]|nr:hypothetical protein K438DRAFT_1996607 [Mycena galopus ATCC 62051]
MADNNRPSNFLRRLVRPAPRVFVPLLYTNIYPEVFDPPAIFRPAAAPALAAAAPAPAAAAPPLQPLPPPPQAAPRSSRSAPPLPRAAAPVPAAAAPAPPACPRDGGHSYALGFTLSIACLLANDSSLPQPRLRRWSLSGGEVIDPPKKAPTKLDVVILIEELYKLGTRNEAEEKYLEFRNLIDNLAKAKLVRDQTLTKQDPDKLQELFKKKNQAAHMAVKKAFSSVSRPSSSTVHKKATPLSLRKTRSMGAVS